MTARRIRLRTWGWLTVVAVAALAIGLSAGKAVGSGSGARKPRNSDAVVRVSATAGRPDAQGRQAVMVSFQVDQGWHIYANPAGPETLANAQTTITAEAANQRVPINVGYPPGRLVKDAIVGDYRVYDGKVAIAAAVRRAPGDTGPLDVVASFQACCHIPDHETCLVPATVRVRVP